MLADRRVYRTEDGRLTLNEAEARFLAYAQGDELAAGDVAAVEQLLAPAAEQAAGAKAAARPADKARRAGADK